MTLFSALVPSYNSENYVLKAIQSILDQTLSDFEIIVSDDFSTDNSRQILSQIKNNPKIKVFFQKSNLGPSENSNFLLRKAKGKFICYVAGDDLMYPWAFKTGLDIFEQYQNVDIIFNQPDRFDEGDNFLYSTKDLNLTDHIGDWTNLLEKGFYAKSNGMMLRNYFEQNIDHNPDSMADDFDYIFDVLHKRTKQFYFLNQPLGVWRKRPNSLSQRRMVLNYVDILEGKLKLYTNFPAYQHFLGSHIANYKLILLEDSRIKGFSRQTLVLLHANYEKNNGNKKNSFIRSWLVHSTHFVVSHSNDSHRYKNSKLLSFLRSFKAKLKFKFPSIF